MGLCGLPGPFGCLCILGAPTGDCRSFAPVGSGPLPHLRFCGAGVVVLPMPAALQGYHCVTKGHLRYSGGQAELGDSGVVGCWLGDGPRPG